MNSKSFERKIHVYADWDFLKKIHLIGILFCQKHKGKEIFSFEYNKEWLKSGNAQILDPNLDLYQGRQYLRSTVDGKEKKNFGLFLDSSPDRWGTILMRRREAALAKQEQREERILLDSDYLLGVYDEHRMGGLRFKEETDGPFLNNSKYMTTPPITSIRELEDIVHKLENEDVIDDPDYLNWLNIIIAPGSSLGGARPKASVIDLDKSLWIAKFPSMSDNSDVGAWEMVVNELAKQSGINAAEAQAKRYGRTEHTYLTKRFDRTSSGERIHFASALTMIDRIDSHENYGHVSYLEIVEFLTTYGANVNGDLEELWKRIVFNILVSNTDDHLRNHGFILTPDGWILSPAYDVNPNEEGTGLHLNITENDNDLDIDLAMEVIDFFRIDEKRALNIITRIKGMVACWKKVADKYSIPKDEQKLKAKAFIRAK
ncbi:MAG: type II toxin-antitoxin system HipA family toxin [Ignavibacteriae bacterium]|nr:MAG: type II toxin-antitoxin system HipA family toxin [Ignavibacteriota bacterium]